MFKIEYKNGSYQGQMIEGKRNGLGIFLWDNGTAYLGEWYDDKFNGEGFIQMPKLGVIQSQLKNNKLHGSSYFVGKSNQLHFATYQFGRLNGRSVLMSQNQKVILQTFHKGQLSNINDAPDVADVEILMDQILSQLSSIDDIVERNPLDQDTSPHFGYLKQKDSSFFVGLIENNLPNGLGLINSIFCRFTKDSCLEDQIMDIYAGDFNQGEMEGLSSHYKSNGDTFFGQIRQNLRNGYGLYWIENLLKWHSGQFENGRCVSIKKSMVGVFNDFQNEAIKFGLQIHSNSENQEKIALPILDIEYMGLNQQFPDHFQQQQSKQIDDIHERTMIQENVSPNSGNFSQRNSSTARIELQSQNSNLNSSAQRRERSKDSVTMIDRHRLDSFRTLFAGQTDTKSSGKGVQKNNYSNSTCSSQTKVRQKNYQGKVSKPARNEIKWQTHFQSSQKNSNNKSFNNIIKPKIISCQTKAFQLVRRNVNNNYQEIPSDNKNTQKQNLIKFNAWETYGEDKTNKNEIESQIRHKISDVNKINDLHSSIEQVQQIKPNILIVDQTESNQDVHQSEFFHLSCDSPEFSKIVGDLECIGISKESFKNCDSMPSPISQEFSLPSNQIYMSLEMKIENYDKILEPAKDQNLLVHKYSSTQFHKKIQSLGLSSINPMNQKLSIQNQNKQGLSEQINQHPKSVVLSRSRHGMGGRNQYSSPSVIRNLPQQIIIYPVQKPQMIRYFSPNAPQLASTVYF